MAEPAKKGRRPSMFARIFLGAKDETVEDGEEEEKFRELSAEELESHNSEHVAGKNLQDLAFGGGDTIMEDQEGEERSTEVSSKYKDGAQVVREMEQGSFVNESVEEKRKRLEVLSLKESAGNRRDFWKARQAMPLPPLTQRMRDRISTASSIGADGSTTIVEGEEGSLMGEKLDDGSIAPAGDKEREAGPKTKSIHSLPPEQRSIFRRYHVERAKSLVVGESQEKEKELNFQLKMQTKYRIESSRRRTQPTATGEKKVPIPKPEGAPPMHLRGKDYYKKEGRKDMHNK